MAEAKGRIGAVLDDFGDHVEFRNTWGDAVYASVDEPTVAARLALAMQDRLADMPPELTPPGDIAEMRIGVHYGQVWVGTDRITGNRIWYGGEVNRAARIEPVTPVGKRVLHRDFRRRAQDRQLHRMQVPLGRCAGAGEELRRGGVVRIGKAAELTLCSLRHRRFKLLAPDGARQQLIAHHP